MPRPDFSGTWIFNRAESTLQIAAPDRTEFVIDHREPLLRIARTHFAGEKADTFSLDLTTDGREVHTGHGEAQLHSRAYWDGDVLVFDTRIERGGQEATNVVRYTLSPDGLRFVANERLRSPSLNYDNVWVMDRA